MRLKSDSRRIKQLAKRRARRAPTCTAPACRMGTAEGVTICLTHTAPATLSASCPPMAGRAARHGHCTPPGKVPSCAQPLALEGGRGRGGLEVQRTTPQDRTVPQIFTAASFRVFLFWPVQPESCPFGPLLNPKTLFLLDFVIPMQKRKPRKPLSPWEHWEQWEQTTESQQGRGFPRLYSVPTFS